MRRPLLNLIIVALALTATGLSGCPEDNSAAEAQAAYEALKAKYGEPFAIKLPGKDGMPGVTIALALTHGAALETLVEPLGSALYKGLKGCPKFVEEATQGRDAVTHFAVADGRVKTTIAADATAGETCVLKSLDGASVKTPPGMNLEGMVRFVFDATEHGASGDPKGGDPDQKGADLKGADQKGADLKGADQRGADQKGADQKGAEAPAR